MHSWKKKLVVSQLALACTLAITSQANATTYNTFGYHDDADTAFSWSDWENKDKLNYINYYGYIYNNTTDGAGNDSNLLIVFYVQIMPDDFVMQLHRF